MTNKKVQPIDLMIDFVRHTAKLKDGKLKAGDLLIGTIDKRPNSDKVIAKYVIHAKLAKSYIGWEKLHENEGVAINELSTHFAHIMIALMGPVLDAWTQIIYELGYAACIKHTEKVFDSAKVTDKPTDKVVNDINRKMVERFFNEFKLKSTIEIVKR